MLLITGRKGRKEGSCGSVAQEGISRTARAWVILPGLTRRDSRFRHRWRCTFPTMPLNSQLNQVRTNTVATDTLVREFGSLWDQGGLVTRTMCSCI